MNNYQYSSGKCVSPATTVDNQNKLFGNYQKKTKEENETGEGLKIFFESKNFNANDRRYEWYYHKINEKDSSILTPRKSGDARKKHRKPEKKSRNEASPEDSFNRSFLFKESRSPKTETVGLNANMAKKKQEPILSHYALRKNYLTRSREIDEKCKMDNEKTPMTSLFPLTKSKMDVEKLEMPVKARGSPFATSQLLSQKPSEKATNKSTEMKATISDSGKRRINEILKSHAQKIQSTPMKTIQIKDYPVHAMDTQKKSSVITAAHVELPAKTSVKSEETKSGETENGLLKEAKEKPESEEKKKIPDVWLKFPQSNELERRLKNSWQEPAVLFPEYKDLKQDKTSEEEKNSTPSEKEDESKSEKRVTYTDRLLLLKMLGKNLEEKKQKSAAEDKQLREANLGVKVVGNMETFTIKHDSLVAPRQLELKVPNPTEIVAEESKDLISLKDARYLKSENLIKTKPTRSSELRDLVAQAIKEHKIFCIFDNHTYIVRPVREELLSRGWLEVIPDRRLIPRRRPPPMGPVYEREKALNERNCNTLEAILAAKETFADEIQETVSRSSFKLVIEKPKIMTAPIVGHNKKSEESLSEALSQFRITPPTPEKKKNNSEIREFVAKYQNYVEKEKLREKEINNLREKEKNAKLNKKEKAKGSGQNANQKPPKSEEKPSEITEEVKALIGSKSFQELWESINDNKKVIMQTATEIKDIGVLYDSTQKTPPAIDNKKEKTAAKQKPAVNAQGNASKTFFSDSEAKTISKIIQSSNARIHFMWLSIKPGIHLKCFNYSPEIVNKFQKTTFCTKIGLWSHLNNMQWYAHEVHYPAKSPRMYNTGEADDLQAFFQDFQLTACIGMLKWLSDTFFERGLKAVQTKRGKVPLKAFEFAIKQCEKYMRFKDNEELNVPEEPSIHQEEWNTFLQWFYIITNDHGKVQESSSAQLMVIYTKAVETLKMMKRHWPEMDIDGRLNIWIMKPYCASCGRGIFMTNNVYYIGQHSKYIVQKYIEKPLLIYNTKFDIRQWFMITKLTPLEIWMYKECYLRFCSQPFALRNLHESVHLSNNSVQRKYISFRDPNLPDQNMWDSNTFQLYLKTIGHPHAWEEIIYPGMRDAIVSTMLAAQDTFDGPRKNWFEVYGADFMLSANVKDGPWLIEINENPAMDPSTKVTARLCPQMLRDVIKVVVDKRANKNASTGQWELIYRQNFSPSFGTVDLDVRGKKIARVPFSTKKVNPLALQMGVCNHRIKPQRVDVMQAAHPDTNLLWPMDAN